MPLARRCPKSRLKTAKEKQFAFLGVYSGEISHERVETEIDLGDFQIRRKDRYDVGLVWYADTVVEVVRTGVPFAADT